MLGGDTVAHWLKAVEAPAALLSAGAATKELKSKVGSAHMETPKVKLWKSPVAFHAARAPGHFSFWRVAHLVPRSGKYPSKRTRRLAAPQSLCGHPLPHDDREAHQLLASEQRRLPAEVAAAPALRDYYRQCLRTISTNKGKTITAADSHTGVQIEVVENAPAVMV